MSLQEKLEMVYMQRKQAEKASKQKRIIMQNVIVTPKESARLFNKNIYVM